MDKENLIGAIIMAVVCFGCAGLFFGLGIYADRTNKPMGFWSGTTIEPSRIKDLEGYNHANAMMWKNYSIPYWIAGIISCFGVKSDIYVMAASILLFIAALPGIIPLIACYRRIERRFLR